MKNKFLVNLTFSSLLTFFTSFTFLPGLTDALPSYRRLVEKKFGYQVSCAMCHAQGGGSALSPYGVDFLKAGAGESAFSTIAPKDSDGDHASNGAEIEKRSNPGHPASTPDAPGEWLDHVEALALPVDHLQLLFPGVTKFSSLEGSLFPDQVTAIQSRLGTTLAPEDLLPTFYFAVKGAGPKALRTGVAIFVRGKGPHGPMTVAVATNLSSHITSVRVFSHQEGKDLHGDTFASQFVGKTLKNQISVGQDLQAPEGLADAASKVASTVRKVLLTIEAVFTKKKP